MSSTTSSSLPRGSLHRYLVILAIIEAVAIALLLSDQNTKAAQLEGCRKWALEAESRAKKANEAASSAREIAKAEVVGKEHPGIRKVTPYRNDVKMGYLDWFSLVGNEITVRVANEGRAPVQPNFRIALCNEDGFVTAEYQDVWTWSKLDPGEAHVDSRKFTPRAGKPVYYHVSMND